MADYEKIVKGFECCTQHGSMCGHDCNGHWGWTDDSHAGMELLGEYRTKCPYGNCETGCVKTLAKDALTLLKEQEPRIITIDEFKQYSGETMWLETKNNELQQLTMEGIAIALMEAEINKWDGYGSYWRCWNRRPMDEQRREVKWDA